jgi:aryl sulfotransferase
MAAYVVRYEDLLADTMRTFAHIASFFKISATPQDIAKSVESSRFSELQAEERAQGYRSRPRPDIPFFRSGKAGAWRQSLSSRQAELIVEDHAEVMSSLGYLEQLRL